MMCFGKIPPICFRIAMYGRNFRETRPRFFHLLLKTMRLLENAPPYRTSFLREMSYSVNNA